MEREVVFVDGVRTAFGRMGGTIRDITAETLAGIGIKGLMDKTKVMDRGGKIDSVFLGSAMHCSKALNPARWALLYAGLPYETTASYIEMQCGSAIDSINHAAWKILTGNADIIVAGGMESYSQFPAKFSMSTPPYRLIPPMPMAPELSPIADENIGMGLTAENLQVMYNISREDQDRFSLRSQVQALKAIEAGYFTDEIVPVMVPQGKKQPPLEFKVDEHPRKTTLEALAALPPAFKKDGTVTAGNASGRNDGSAFVLMMSAEKAKELGYEPMARWLSGAEAGCDPRIMGIAPAYAVPVALKRAGLRLSDMDLMECNEAFAVQNLAVIKEIEKQTGEKVDLEGKWNVNGGAIAFGHPNGASGARICMFAMRELIRRGGRYAFFSSCCGGGLGVATVLENLKR